MLKGIPAILSPELLKILMEMGHGDTIVIGDGKVTLLELASYVKDKVKTDILDYVATNGADSVKNSTAQDPQYYLTTPDLVVYARAKAQ